MATSVTRLEAGDKRLAELDWRAVPQAGDRPQAIGVEGRYRYARRCIDPPCFDLTSLPRAVSYELLVAPLDAPQFVWSLRDARPRIDLSAAWHELPYGRLQILPRAWDSQECLIGLGDLASIIRSPDWQDRPVSPADYHAVARGVIDYLVNRAGEAPQHPGDPIYMWHASIAVAGPADEHPCQFPALTYPSFIDLFLIGAECGIDVAPDVDLVGLARRLGDFLIDRPATASGPLAGVPLSTMNQQGVGAMFEQDRITLVRLGWTGRAFLRLARATGEQRFAACAERLARILLDFQQSDGSWPYRVQLGDGTIVEPYTAAAIMPLLLLEQLELDDPAGRYTAAIERGLAWLLQYPVRTGLWQQMYEDVQTLAPYANLEQWAALETAMFLLRRRRRLPGVPALAIAHDLVRYVENQFVIFGDDPITPAPYLPFTPCALEQYVCYWPMDSHTANYARAALALYEATGEATWAKKAIAAANTIVNCRLPDGRLSTIVPDRRLGLSPPFATWFNCMALAADVLLRIGPRLSEIGTCPQ